MNDVDYVEMPTFTYIISHAYLHLFLDSLFCAIDTFLSTSISGVSNLFNFIIKFNAVWDQVTLTVYISKNFLSFIHVWFGTKETEMFAFI